VKLKLISLVQYGKRAFYKYIDVHGRQPTRKDLLTKMLTVEPESGSTPLSDLQMYSEVGNLVFAGTGNSNPRHTETKLTKCLDTTSTTLTYLFWELAKHKEWQAKLRNELEGSLGSETEAIPLYHALAELPILDAIVNETLRLHPAAPASLQRSTPVGGRELAGYHIPEGVSLVAVVN